MFFVSVYRLAGDNFRLPYNTMRHWHFLSVHAATQHTEAGIYPLRPNARFTARRDVLRNHLSVLHLPSNDLYVKILNDMYLSLQHTSKRSPNICLFTHTHIITN